VAEARRRSRRPRASEIKAIIDTATTAEALAVTYPSAVVKSAKGTPVAKFKDVLKAGNTEEYDHLNGA